MVTMVGNQTDFIDAVKKLLELEYDAVEAYESAINRIESENYKAMLINFKKDHDLPNEKYMDKDEIIKMIDI